MDKKKKTNEDVKALAANVLEHKWHPNSTWTKDGICSFCMDADWSQHTSKKQSKGRCAFCVCPPGICSDYGKKGLVSKIGPDLKISDLWDTPAVQAVVTALRALAEVKT